jgi:hypothetical protein
MTGERPNNRLHRTVRCAARHCTGAFGGFFYLYTSRRCPTLKTIIVESESEIE